MTAVDQTTYVGEIVIVTCWCGIRCGLPAELDRYRRRRADDGDPFSVYCPLGHTFIPAGKSKTERLQDRLDAEKKNALWWRERAQRADRQSEHDRRSAAATRGAMTKLRKRVANGVCPKAGCKRSFSDMHAHVATCHPELLGVLEVES